MLVLDSNVVVAACTTDEGFGWFGTEELAAPPLMWSEATSVIHEAMWRGAIDRDLGSLAFDRLRAARIKRRNPDRLSEQAWLIADELGWAKTYDAEYVALAKLLRCRLLTLDGRLRRRAARLGFVIGPAEL